MQFITSKLKILDEAIKAKEKEDVDIQTPIGGKTEDRSHHFALGAPQARTPIGIFEESNIK